uniref:Peptidase C1A papain C-terminal domain-containing protein n=1 Tax=Timema douglasi TaxID=61478 RepID=A0A7R8VFC8_TIMDO|nr:unnamed protein product [Timema douglasi]
MISRLTKYTTADGDKKNSYKKTPTLRRSTRGTSSTTGLCSRKIRRTDWTPRLACVQRSSNTCPASKENAKKSSASGYAELRGASMSIITDQASDVIVKRHVFHDNMDFIKSHNELHDRNEREFRVTRNKFAHMSVSEMCSRYTGLIVDEDTDPTYDEDMSILGSSETGTSSSSGTTDTAVEVLEAQWLKVKNRSVGLSEQYLIDCSEQKCSGGTFKNVFEFIKQNWTVARSAYPYTALVGVLEGADDQLRFWYIQLETGCFPCPQVHSARDRMFSLSPGIFSSRQDVFLVPSSPQVYSAQGRMFSLSPGIFSLKYDGENCTTINHAITLWGYVNDNNSSYFILKNSWGPAWGESGYMRLKMGENNCGVGDLCYYITVE